LRTAEFGKLLNQRSSELDEFSIKFKETAITPMKELTEPYEAVLMLPYTQSTTFAAVKFHQMLRGTEHIMLSLLQLLHYKTEVMLAWKRRFVVLVVESQTSTENFEVVADEISTFLNECGVKKSSFS
jgi:hypothetical protein